MAIKIETNNIVRVFRPVGKAFTLQEINDEVGGLVEPQKVGPLWLMYDEEQSGEVNRIATMFFDSTLRGTVLVIPPQELPAEWEAMDETDYRYQASDVDTGFLLALQKAMAATNAFGSGSILGDGISRFMSAQEEWVYTPPDTDELDENTIDFYNQVYDYISKNPDMFKKNFLFSESTMVVKIEQEQEKKKMIQQMIDYYISTEEYEKCRFLRDALEE